MNPKENPSTSVRPSTERGMNPTLKLVVSWAGAAAVASTVGAPEARRGRGVVAAARDGHLERRPRVKRRAGQREVLARRQRQLRLETAPPLSTATTYEPASSPSSTLLPARLAQLGDERAARLAHADAAAELGRQHQARLRGAHVGHHHVARPRQIELVGGVLGAALRALGARQRLLRRELIRLLQGDAPVRLDVGGAAQAGDEVVGEERGGDPIGLLRAPRWRRSRSGTRGRACRSRRRAGTAPGARRPCGA